MDSPQPGSPVAIRLRTFWLLFILIAVAGTALRVYPAASLMVAALCGYEFRQYIIFATNPATPLYEPIPTQTLRLINIIKDEKPQ